MFSQSSIAMLTLFAVCAMVSNAGAQDQPEWLKLNFAMKSIDGKDVKLAEKYKGKAVVLVNVASKCGYTRQYAGLQELHKKYAEQGLAVIGVPCNQFGGQEPGTEAEIVEFCQANYGVEFDMLSKVDVKGEAQCDLYKYLTNLDLAPKGKGPVKWNFEKIVIDRDGNPIARFPSSTEPMSKEMISAVEKALQSKANTSN